MRGIKKIASVVVLCVITIGLIGCKEQDCLDILARLEDIVERLEELEGYYIVLVDEFGVNPDNHPSGEHESLTQIRQAIRSNHANYKSLLDHYIQKGCADLTGEPPELPDIRDDITF